MRRRQNASTGQLEYHLDKVEGMRKMRAKVVAPKTKPVEEVVVKGKKQASADPVKAEVKSKNGKLPTVSLKKGKPSSERAAAEEAARQLSKGDLDRDVKCVYKTLLESYKPARATRNQSHGVSSGKSDKTKIKGFDLIDCARVLLDTKQFVKTYTPVEALLDMKVPKHAKVSNAIKTATRVMVTAVIDSRNKGPKVSGMGSQKNLSKAEKAKRKRQKNHGVETKPPAEVVLLPADPTLFDLKQAASKCFADLYVVLKKFKVKTVVGLEQVKDASKVGKKVSHKNITVDGEGADLDSEFRYQGGLDQWTVRCVCGTCDDDGQRMIACDACEVWMHTRCVGIGDDAGTPRRWTCTECEAEAAREAARLAKAGKLKPAAPKPTQPPQKKQKPAPAPEKPRNRPPPTKRRPLPERFMPRRGRR